jgi:hypothetical protein
VRVAEGHAGVDQPLGQRRGHGVPAAGRAGHCVTVEGDTVQHPVGRLQAQLQRGHRVEHRRAKLLEVAVVAERQAVEDAEHRGEGSSGAGGAPPDELGDVGIPLVRQHRAAGRVAVGDAREAEVRRRPQDEVGTEARQVGECQRAGADQLDRIVAVGHGVDAVGRDRGEAQLRGDSLAIEGQAAAGGGARAGR